MNIDYYIINPTGNITALVTTNVCPCKYDTITKRIMELHNEVEQVGFVDLSSNTPYLRMSGGEFCGNATMCAAVLFCEKNNYLKKSVGVNVYGIEKTLSVNVSKINDCFSCELSLPKSNSIEEMSFEINGLTYSFPIVNAKGISHIIVKGDLEERVVKNILTKYCEKLLLPAMGIMLYNETTGSLTPYVYVRSINTLFAENSCGSGTCALCEYLSMDFLYEKEFTFNEPGGILKASSSKNSSFVRLFENIDIVKHFCGEISI